jgi:tyrosine-protein phosphatase SIW14
MTRSLQTTVGIVVVLVLIVLPPVFGALQMRHTRHLRVVREGVLYRSAQITVPGLQRIVHNYGIRTVINLRDKTDSRSPKLDADEEEFCANQEINFYRIMPKNWEAMDGSVPVEPSVQLFLKIMRDPRNHPVLVHCQRGVHRTGAYCAIFRMEFDGWSNAQAIAEVKACGYDNLENEWDVLGYLERYRPTWAAKSDVPTRDEWKKKRLDHVSRW